MEPSDDAGQLLDVHFPDRRFPPGQLGMTSAAAAALTHAEIMTALRRHLAADWGDVDEHDWQENELSLREGFRLLSAYHTGGGQKFWILTEADRSHTTVMLPEGAP
jgi:hypothetical protein